MSVALPTLILSILPAVETLGRTYCMKLPAVSAWILVFIVSILSSDIPPDLRKAAVSILLYLYWRNIHILLRSLTEFSLSVGPSAIAAVKSCLSLHFNVQIKGLPLPARPTLFICNYACDRFENLFPLFIPRKMVYIMSEIYADVSGFDGSISTIIVPDQNGFSLVSAQIQDVLQRGENILCYCQKPLFVDDCNYGRVRRGIFQIAHKLGFTVTPVYIEPIKTYLKAVYYQNIEILIGKTELVLDASQTILNVKHFFKTCHETYYT